MSAIVQAGGEFTGNQAQASAYNANARNEQEQARIAQEQSFVRAGEIGDLTRKATASQRAAFAAGGVDPNRGTPLMVMADTAARGAMARELALYQGRVNALGSQEQSDADLAAKSAANQAAWLLPIGTLLTASERAAATAMSGGGG